MAIPVNSDSAAEARALVASGSSAALGTIDRQTGSPYVSLVNVATSVDNAPVLLLSALARHTQNIESDSRASLLFTADAGAAEPLTLGRLTLLGQLTHTRNLEAKASFLERHPTASQYAGFTDFAFYRFEIAGAHFIGGFGRIVKLSRTDLLKL